ncbi:MAG: DNA-J related domain-containing protein [Paraglaciecola sp.]|uniref:DNA-J related domain-containing protein n=1 Tax=Paraglaciecola sp. TaxID=1920173 RepID=UPI0032677957
MQHTPSDWAPLQPILQHILLSHSDGLSEFDIFQILKAPPYELFSQDALQNPLSMFQSHFILFNALYQLADSWVETEMGGLDIHCTCIRRLPWQAGQYGIVAEDNLRAYYLDWENLKDTNQSQVEDLLNNFWDAFSGASSTANDNQMTLQQALDLLNLSSPFSGQRLKQQYRKMLHKHHPDKGGTQSKTIELYKAYQTLKSAYKD